MNIKQLIKQKRKEYPKKMPTLKRIKIGRVIAFVAALPLFTSWMFAISAPIMMTINPTAWARGRLNERKGNGDLKWETK